jgi:hypothetical protein
MTDKLESLLNDDLLHPPRDFTARVMHEVRAHPPMRVKVGRQQRIRWVMTIAGLVSGGLLGLPQLIGFVMGLWVTTAAL